MSWLLIFILTFYCFIIFLLFLGFGKLNHLNEIHKKAALKFSICIPFRNEAENLPVLLYSLSQIDYPKNRFEIIMVNDGSMDSSVQIIEDFIKKNSFPNSYQNH